MKKRILCFGDSNTWGYNGADGIRFDDNVRWTGRLQKLLGDGYTIIEEGHNGRTTVWDDPVENRLAGLTYFWPCMDSQSPLDLIILMLGTNDTKCYFNVSADCIAMGAGRLVDMAQKSPFGRDGTAPKILLVSPIRLEKENGFQNSFDEEAAKKSEKFPEAFQKIAELYGCYYLNAAEFAEPGSADGIHLDEAGHAALAKAMEKKVREILG